MFPSYIAPDFDFLQPQEYYIVARPCEIDNYFLELLHLTLITTEFDQYAD
jgi:hypothetical protein